jgi:hypothetical protein
MAAIPLGCLCGGGKKTEAAKAAPSAVPAAPALPARLGIWRDVTLTTSTDPSPLTPPSGYAQADGTSSILYSALGQPGRTTLYQWIEKANSWQVADLCGSAGVPCSPWAGARGYVRSDGISTVIYAEKVGNKRHVKELTWNNGQHRWNHADLNAITNGPGVDGRPFPYVRADKTNSIVYCQYNGDVRETFMVGDKWADASLRDVAKGGGLANCDVCDPQPFAISNGQSIVVYLGVDRHIHALRIAGGAWFAHDLTAETRSPHEAAPCPTVYQRADGQVSVLYKVVTPAGFRIREITGEYKPASNSWVWLDWDFTNSVNPAPPPPEDCAGYLCNVGDVFGYVADGIQHVMYAGRGGMLQDVTFRAGRGWVLAVPSPSEQAGADGVLFPSHYLRKDGTPAVTYVTKDRLVHELGYE